MSGQQMRLLAPSMLVIITDTDKVKTAREALNDSLLRFMFTIAATGTAKSELLDVLGLDGSEKTIIICLLPGFRAPEAMRRVADALSVRNPGGGIVLSIPLSGMGALISRLFDEEHVKKLIDTLEPEKRKYVLERFRQASEHPEFQQKKQAIERIEEKMESGLEKPADAAHDLILSVINLGYSDELMDAAREAGARGGTIVHARRSGPDDAVKFFGISLQAEKEVVAILTERGKRNAIMKAISHSCGLTTEAAGIVFSVPVDGIAGLGGE